MKTCTTLPLILAVGALSPTFTIAQQPPSAAYVLRGTVTAAGAPVRGADVFLLESLDGATTDTSGHFSIRTKAAGSVTIVVRRIGFAPATLVVPVDTADAVTLALFPETAVLTPITVQAGAYTAGNERGATLTALEVVTTPGATADIARAIQTLPGVQNVDEGTGLFVRGGDVSETKVLLNNTVMLSPYNYQTPTGNYTVTVNPFLLDGIFFSSGGFGARYGNILSGVADLRTAGRPVQSSETVVAGLASVSSGADLALSHGLTLHATAGHSDLRYLFDVNGSTRGYSPIPNGNDFSGSVIYDYSPTGQIKTFAIDRSNAVGIEVSDPSYAGGYFADVKSQMFTGGWSDVFGSFAPTVSVSYSTARRNEEYGVFGLGTDERWTQVFTQTAWSPRDEIGFRVGRARRRRHTGLAPRPRGDRAARPLAHAHLRARSRAPGADRRGGHRAPGGRRRLRRRAQPRAALPRVPRDERVRGAARSRPIPADPPIAHREPRPRRVAYAGGRHALRDRDARRLEDPRQPHPFARAARPGPLAAVSGQSVHRFTGSPVHR